MHNFIRTHFNPTIYVLIVIELIVLFYTHNRAHDTTGTIFAGATLLSLIALLELEILTKFWQYVTLWVFLLAAICQVSYAIFF